MQRRRFIGTVGAASAGAVLCGTHGRDSRAGPSAAITGIDVIRVREKGTSRGVKEYVTVSVEGGVTGVGGDLFQAQPARLRELLPRLRALLIGREVQDRSVHSEWLWRRLYPETPLKSYAEGRDPLTGASIWGTRRSRRHTSTGSYIMALSAVDNALWDARGKAAGQPVYRLLGGSRTRLRGYMSLMPTDDLKSVRRRARELYDSGITSQKWFLRHGPPDGKKGFRMNVDLIAELRSELGAEARLMCDFAVGYRGKADWDVPYAVSVAKAIAPFAPYWLEEPFSPEEIGAYERLLGETGIHLATGEHTYTRWNIAPFLKKKLVRFVQCDPEWCGGVSELLATCALVTQHEGVQLIPHGHHVLAAAQVVASQSERLCPMVEYGEGWIPGRQRYQRRQLVLEKGFLTVPGEPGLGPDLDWDRLERV